MSYISHALRKAREEQSRLDFLIKRGTATKYQKQRAEQLIAEYGIPPKTPDARQSAKGPKSRARRGKNPAVD